MLDIEDPDKLTWSKTLYGRYGKHIYFIGFQIISSLILLSLFIINFINKYHANKKTHLPKKNDAPLEILLFLFIIILFPISGVIIELIFEKCIKIQLDSYTNKHPMNTIFKMETWFFALQIYLTGFFLSALYIKEYSSMIGGIFLTSLIPTILIILNYVAWVPIKHLIVIPLIAYRNDRNLKKPF